MRAGMLRGIVFILVGLWLIIAFSGCTAPHPRRGLLVRGDWSLEFNRVPWRNDQPQDCQKPDCASSQVSPAMSPDGVNASAETSVSPCKCARGCGGEQLLVNPAPCVDYVNHPRFFPVPTKPVFSPRDDVLPASAEALVPEPEVLSTPAAQEGTTASKSKLSQPEPVPTPPAPPTQNDPQTAVPRRLDATEDSGWVFNPPTPPSTTQKLPVRTRQTTASNKAVKVHR